MLFSKNTKLRRRRKRGKNYLKVVGGYLAKAAKVLVVSKPSTVIYLTKLYKKLLAILLYTYSAVERQQGSKVLV